MKNRHAEAMRSQGLRRLRAELRADGVLSAGYISRLVHQVANFVAKETANRERIELRKFMTDEMAACADINKLRKLALCRLRDPRYENYRREYFDGKDPQ